MIVLCFNLVLHLYIKQFINKEVYEEILPDLYRFGDKCANVYPKQAEESERYKPVFEKYDAWGK
jgi:hypothetical protein